MARPIKNSCDYFPHDAGMRNHIKVKAIREKFKNNGYSIWVMLLEFLTGADGNVFEYSDMQFELLGGDFGVSVTEIREVVDYCIRLEMLFMVDGFVNSESLDERLSPVYQKRRKAKEVSAKQKRLNGKFAISNTDNTVVTVTETPQIKEKKIKENNNIKSRRFTPPLIDDIISFFEIDKSISPDVSKTKAEKFFLFYNSKDWMVGKNKMTNWKSAATRSLSWTDQPMKSKQHPSKLTTPKIYGQI